MTNWNTHYSQGHASEKNNEMVRKKSFVICFGTFISKWSNFSRPYFSSTLKWDKIASIFDYVAIRIKLGNAGKTLRTMTGT